MITPLLIVAGFVNLLGQNLNYAINNTVSPDLDIRVRRSVPEYVPTPLELHKNDDNKQIDMDTPIILRKLKGSKFRPKRDVYQQNLNQQSEPYYNNGYINDHTGNNYAYNGYNGNNNAYNGNNGYVNNNESGNIANTRWKTKPNFFKRAYFAVSQGLGYTTSTARPYRYSYNGYNGNNYNSGLNNQNGVNTNQVNYGWNAPTQYPPTNNLNNGYNDGHLYPNNAIKVTTELPSNGNGGNDGNGNNGRRVRTTTEKIESSCILCSTFSCPDNQKRVGFTCRDVSYEDDYVNV